MNHRTPGRHFRVTPPARAYTVLVAVSGLLLFIGLALPLTLASAGSSSAESGHASTGPIEVEGDAGTSGSTGTSTADQIPEQTQGVTDTSIKVGVVLLDLSSVEPLGLGLPNYSTEIQRAAYDSLFDEINADGGINGRTIVPVYESRDSLATSGPHSDKAICIKLAKDEQVFALIGTTYDAGTCAASQYDLPVVTKNASLEEVYQDSHGLLVTLDPALERDGRDWAKVLVKAGLADGHELGMVTVADGGSSQLPAEAAADQLEELGHPLTVMGKLDASNSIAEIPTLIQKMKSAGVDTVMLASDFANALRFIALAEDQHFYPQYLTSDLGSLATNGLLANAGKSLDGAIGFADTHSASGSEMPQMTRCRENYNATTDTPDVPAGEQSVLGIVCSTVAVFERAATDAGDDLNSRTFVQAVEGIGSMDDEIVGVLPGSFGPGKSDYADQLQPVRWSSDCQCYSPDGDAVDVR